MLPATQDEIDQVTDYMLSQAPDLGVRFVQKVYSENVLDARHDVWDIHTDSDRWWVITSPMNLYAQDQFPNMDLALTFHVGLCLRIPRSARTKLSDLPVEPFIESYRQLQDANDALQQSAEVADYQAIGVRCRECLLSFVAACQLALPWTSEAEPPKKADVKAWTDHIFNTTLPGSEHEHRRHLYKNLIESGWKFVNWLTHAKVSHWNDAEAAIQVTENAIELCTTAVIRRLRGVPDCCPSCGSQRLSPERGYRSDLPNVEWERPTCDKCDWTGTPVQVASAVREAQPESASKNDGECVVQSTPLLHLRRPGQA